jgi:hypothetical protein
MEGLACYDAIKAHPSEVVTHIVGLAGSIASVVALAGDRVCMAKNAFVMIHSGWAKASGDPAELRKQADVLDKMSNTIAGVYAEKSGKKVEEVRAAMDAETWFDAAEAKAWGLVDEIEGEGDEAQMASSALLAVAKYQRVPPALRTFAASAARHLTQTSNPQQKGQPMAVKNLKVKYMAGVSNSGEIPCPHCNQPINVELETPAAEEQEAQNKAAIAKAREDGKSEERAYRNMFNTVLGTAKLDASGAVEFEKQFYGRPETDLKFLASHAIGQRAKPLGEGSPGNGEGESVTDAAKADQKTVAEATERFASTPTVRRMFGLTAALSADHPLYKASLEKYIAGFRQAAKDQAKNKTVAAK